MRKVGRYCVRTTMTAHSNLDGWSSLLTVFQTKNVINGVWFKKCSMRLFVNLLAGDYIFTLNMNHILIMISGLKRS